ncbi:radical SAM/SPASM domain-containing protein [Streptomyces pilosus]|uniref:radical SAM/SPASM domain-containing protein n=1 Tax=Streptomyces pilosus TaxID=28893 RepID=UPI0036F5E1A8
MTEVLQPPTRTAPGGVTFLELEITSRCQLTCSSHCYAEAGPTKAHGTMTTDDWKQVIDEAARIGVTKVQFIGGEPTLHPDFTKLVGHALDRGIGVQVYSNLYRVRLEHWRLFEHPGVSLATSYYADTDEGHDAVTGRKGSHAATRANIIEALRRGIHVQVGIVDVLEGQRVDQARAELEALGVTDINIDRVRGVGNAAKLLPSTSELCGNCAKGRAAIMPDGTVTPCVLGRFLPTGSVKGGSLKTVFESDRWGQVKQLIPQRVGAGCTPDEDSCMPSPGANSSGACTPADSNDCDPSRTPACNPKYN